MSSHIIKKMELVSLVKFFVPFAVKAKSILHLPLIKKRIHSTMSPQPKTFFRNYHRPGGVKELLVLSLPMIISMACDGIMVFTDRLFLARVDSVQMNAVLGGGIALEVLLFFFIGLTGYSTALVAQYYGAAEKQNAPKATFQAMLIALLAWPIILLLKPVVISFFYLMHIPLSQVGYQIQYLNILAWCSVFGLLRHVLSCYFSGIGHTRVVMNATLAALLVNIVLDYILIFGKLGLEPMGIRGAGIATVSGEAAAMLMLFYAYLRRNNRFEFGVLKSFRFNWPVMRTLLYYGSPAGLEMFLNFMAFACMVGLFQGQGEVAATASTIMFNWDMVSFIPLIGIEIGVTSLVGRYMGAGRTVLAEHAAYSGIKIGVFYSAAILLLFVSIPVQLVHVFHPDTPTAIYTQVVPIAVSMIRIAALYVLAEAVTVALVGALRGAGDTYFTMFASISVHWLFVPILYLSLNVFHLSVPLSWFFLILLFFVFCTVLILRFRGGKWKKIKVIESVEKSN